MGAIHGPFARSNAQKGFEDVIDEKTAKVKMLQSAVTEKTATKATKSQELADAEELLEATQKQVADDKEIFEMARQSCKEKSDEWDERGPQPGKCMWFCFA